jgi:hypothetical protein
MQLAAPGKHRHVFGRIYSDTVTNPAKSLVPWARAVCVAAACALLWRWTQSLSTHHHHITTQMSTIAGYWQAMIAAD